MLQINIHKINLIFLLKLTNQINNLKGGNFALNHS